MKIARCHDTPWRTRATWRPVHFLSEHEMRVWSLLLARYTSMRGMCVIASDLASIRHVREAAAGDWWGGGLYL